MISILSDENFNAQWKKKIHDINFTALDWQKTTCYIIIKKAANNALCPITHYLDRLIATSVLTGN